MEAVAIKKEVSRIPKLRFKEFEGEWNSLLLGDLFTFKNGLNSDKDKYGSGVKFINVLDIINEAPITYESIIGSVEVSDKEFEKNEVGYGDVLFQRSSETREEVGQANVYIDKNQSAVFGGFVIRGKGKLDYDPLFMNYLLKTSPARKEITTKSGGSTRYNVGQESLSSVWIKTTSIPEQQKIASFLTAVDEKSQQLTRKKALLEQYKKGVMQKLFAQQIRFKDENGNDYPDWEEKKLGEVGNTFNGLTGKTKEDFGVGKPYIQYMQIFLGSKINPDEFGYVSIRGNEKQTKAKYGDAFFTTSSETPNEIGTASVLLDHIEEVYLNSFCFGYRPKSLDLLFPEFLQFLFRSEVFRRKIIPLAQGSTRYNMSKVELLKLKVDLPSLPEQQKIATYLSSLDQKIETVNHQITHTQTFKKGLLQGMFV